MYRVAAAQINRGLSPTARLILGASALPFGSVMFLVAPSGPKAIYFYGFAGFCLLITVACATRGRTRQFVGSAIGTLLFGATAMFLGNEISTGDRFFSGRSQPSVWNAALCLFFFGVPGAAYALRVRFGFLKPKPHISDRPPPPNQRLERP